MLYVSDRAFTFLLGLVLLAVTALGVMMLVNPSTYLRWIRNPWMKDTPWNRVQMRIFGLLASLFILMIITDILNISKSPLLEGFHENVLMGLWVVFFMAWVVGLLSWVLWQIPPIREFVRSRFTAERLEKPAWERRMTAIFCCLLSFVVGVALVLAAIGHHP
jgi:hypothetical protein